MSIKQFSASSQLTIEAASATGVCQLSKRFTVAAVMISKPLEESGNSCDAFSSGGVWKTAVIPSALEESGNSCDAFSSGGVWKTAVMPSALEESGK